MQKQLNADKQQFGQLVAQLEGVSPLATLARLLRFKQTLLWLLRGQPMRQAILLPAGVAQAGFHKQLQSWHYRLQQSMQKQLNADKQQFGQLVAQLEDAAVAAARSADASGDPVAGWRGASRFPSRQSAVANS
jgi:exonuclease VII large subunit